MKRQKFVYNVTMHRRMYMPAEEGGNKERSIGYISYWLSYL